MTSYEETQVSLKEALQKQKHAEARLLALQQEMEKVSNEYQESCELVASLSSSFFLKPELNEEYMKLRNVVPYTTATSQEKRKRETNSTNSTSNTSPKRPRTSPPLHSAPSEFPTTSFPSPSTSPSLSHSPSPSNPSSSSPSYTRLSSLPLPRDKTNRIVRQGRIAYFPKVDVGDGDIVQLRYNPAIPKRFATISGKGFLKLWDIPDASEVPVKGVTIPPERLKTAVGACDASWSPDGNQLLVSLADEDRKRLCLVTVVPDTWKTKVRGIGTAHSANHTTSAFLNASFEDPEKKLLLVGASNGEVHSIILPTAEWKNVLTMPSAVSAIQANTGSKQIYTGSQDGEVSMGTLLGSGVFKEIARVGGPVAPVRHIVEKPNSPSVVFVVRDQRKTLSLRLLDFRVPTPACWTTWISWTSANGFGEPQFQGEHEITLGGSNSFNQIDFRTNVMTLYSQPEGENTPIYQVCKAPENKWLLRNNRSVWLAKFTNLKNNV
mmetsp:Transcript_26478/g.41219  ORF Transcript_26478/g.41219 Transcript_26478/m.41219 type:complete len:493 (-) Transcript_26478:45-1523(-)